MIFLKRHKKYVTRTYGKEVSFYYGISDYYINGYLYGYDSLLLANKYVISYRTKGIRICYVCIDNSVLSKIILCKITYEVIYELDKRNANTIYDLEKYDEIYIGNICTTTAKIYIDNKQIPYKKCRLSIEHTSDIRINIGFS
jgi:hypothetical protein